MTPAQKLEIQIYKLKQDLAKLRSKESKKLISDLTLVIDGKKTLLSKLFGKHSQMILIHNMGSDCRYCMLWADGFNGIVDHLESRAAFVVENDDLPKVVEKYKKSRVWKFKFASSAGTPLKQILGFQKSGENVPGVSVLVKDKSGKIYQTSRSIFGPGDNYCNTWDLFNLLPGGAKNFEPKSKY